MKHRTYPRALLAAAVLVAGAAVAPPASAVPPARRLNVVVFEPATGAGVITVDSAARLEHLTLRFGLGFDYAAESLHAGGSNRGEYVAVERLGVVTVSAAIGLFGHFEFGVQLPVVVLSKGGDGVGAPTTLSGVAASDVRLVPKLGWGLGDGAGWALALSPVVTLPSGASDKNAGERGATFEPEIALSYRFAQGTELALNLGYRARPSLPFGRLLVDDEFTFGFGTRVVLYEGFSLSGEVFGAVGLHENPADPEAGVDEAELPVEALGALGYRFDNGFELVVGGGAGLTQGWGAPAYRAFLSFGLVVDTKPVPDADGDGIHDSDDSCPEAAEDRDGFEDQDGCPDLDNDGDGVPDVADRCPREAEDQDGFEDQDGCPDPDNDGDGVLDAADRCPLEAEDRDGFEDQDGCPDPDNDGDGVLDAADRCPDAPETANGVDDEDGCPDKAEATLTDKGIELDDAIYFFLGRAEIMEKSQPLLDKVAKLMLANPQVTLVRVEGHTDNLGVAHANLELSKARAQAVVEALVGRGVAAERLTSEGYGSTRPVCKVATKECWARNRRTEFKLVAIGGVPVPE